MDFSQLHFSHPLWLCGVIFVPFVWILYIFFYRTHHPVHQLEKFVDSHLLPYLLINHTTKTHSLWKTLLLWSVVWSCLVIALAGPRWTFREMETFSKDQSLVILLDLSESMNATDVKSSRLARAKQKIEDLINLSKGVKIGFIAFAADPHMLTPVTEDTETILHLLPSLGTDLVYIQGSRLSSALDMASTMLDAEPGRNKAILVISDGGFEDSSAMITAKKIADKGVYIYAMGVGTLEGAPMQDHEGNVIKKHGTPVLSKLEKERLSEISKAGNGRYLETHYSDHAENAILMDLEKRSEAQMQIGKKSRHWDEHFYLLILPVLPIILWWFRRGVIIAVMLILCAPTFGLEATTIHDYFKNSEELGKQAVDNGDYTAAIQAFQDPYRKGVAYYKAGQFAEAEKMFRQSSRAEMVCNATYNLGNALAQQQKFKEAITAYEDVLKKWPDHTKAKENLELIKKMLEQQKQDSSNSDNSDQKENQDQEESENKEKDEGERQHSNTSKEQEPKQEDERQQQNNDSSDEQSQTQAKPENQQKPQKEDDKDLNANSEQQPKGQEATDMPQGDEQEPKSPKSQEDQDADLWLNRITNDPKKFLKNKFTIESKRNGTKEGVDPW